MARLSRICLPMQETGLQSLVQEDPTIRGATKPVRNKCWACALEPRIHNKRGHLSEKAVHKNFTITPSLYSQTKVRTATKAQNSQKYIKKKKVKEKKMPVFLFLKPNKKLKPGVYNQYDRMRLGSQKGLAILV